MLTIVSAIILATVIGILVHYYDKSSVFMPTFLFLSITCLGLIFGLIVPLSGFTEPMVGEITALSKIAENDGKDCYLIITDNGKYIYETKVASNEYGVPETSINILEKDKVRYFEVENTKTAVLKKYVRRGNKSLFTYAFLTEEELEYVFFIPKDSVIK